MDTTTATTHPHARIEPDPAHVTRALAKRSFAMLATVSPRGRPHVAGVSYQLVDTHLYVNTDRSSRKARNVAADPHVAVTIPVRRLPVGPPAQVHFQATAEVLAIEDVRDLLDAGALTSLTSLGQLDRPDVCFLRITPPSRLHTYGFGPLRQVLRHPLDAAGTVAFPPA